MKSLKSIIIGTCVAIASLAFVSIITRTESRAAEIGGGEQYKIMVIDSYQNRATGSIDIGGLEAALNQLGGQGWKLRASVGKAIILAK